MNKRELDFELEKINDFRIEDDFFIEDEDYQLFLDSELENNLDLNWSRLYRDNFNIRLSLYNFMIINYF